MQTAMRSSVARTALPRRRPLAAGPAAPSRPRAVRIAAGQSYTVELRMPNGKFAAFNMRSDGPSIYDAANYAGVSLPASCRQGSCTACCARVTSGTVKGKGSTCVPASLAKEGYITMCTSWPTSDVTIETHQGRAVRLANQEAAAHTKW